MTEKKTTTSAGISTSSLLGVVFVTLKLCGVIDWSWWWVTVPFWGPVAIVIAMCLGVLLLAVLVKAWELALGGGK